MQPNRMFSSNQIFMGAVKMQLCLPLAIVVSYMKHYFINEIYNNKTITANLILISAVKNANLAVISRRYLQQMERRKLWNQATRIYLQETTGRRLDNPSTHSGSERVLK